MVNIVLKGNSLFMPRLVFRYGTMGSAKTAHLLMMAYNLESKGKCVCVVKPRLDTRFGQNTVVSRVGISRDVDLLITDDTLDALQTHRTSAAIFVDEAQFLNAHQVEALRALAQNVDVFCYGLRIDYRGFLFEGSRRLCELADNLEEIDTTCSWCHDKAMISAKYTMSREGAEERVRVIKDGSDAPDLGAEDKYTALCWACWQNGSAVQNGGANK